jgi:hypothetical protein
LYGARKNIVLRVENDKISSQSPKSVWWCDLFFD